MINRKIHTGTKTNVVLGLMMALTTACTFSSGVSDDIKNKQMVCTDTRDGEVFGFNTNNITNVRIGYGAETSFDVVDDTGLKRTLYKSMQLFLKCE